MSGIKYKGLNEQLSPEEMGTFTELLFRLVRWSEGGVNGVLWLGNEETGEKMQVHLDAHDAVLCEMHALEELDKTVGRTLQ